MLKAAFSTFVLFILFSCGTGTITLKQSNLLNSPKIKSGVFVRDQTVNFIYLPSQTNITSVAITGDFNGWNPLGWSFSYSNEIWSLSFQLPYGIYQYKLILNGSNFIANPYSEAFAPDGKGGKNSILEVLQNSDRTN